MNDDPDALPRRGRRWRRLAALVLVAVLAVLALLWIERRELARDYADDLLAERHVPARYAIADLGVGGQRLTDVVLGDPARPDLTADWVETETRLGWNGPYVTAIRAGRVRARGRLAGGRVSFGVLDRLLPVSAGGRFALPDIRLEIADGRLRLDTPAGSVGLKLVGAGQVRSGFAGTLAAVAPTLANRGCTATGATGYWQVATDRGAIRVRGPARGAALACGDWRVRDAVAVADVRIGAGFDRVEGTNRLALAEVRAPSVWLTGVAGTVRVRGPFPAAQGEVALTSGPGAAFGASAAGLRADGRFRVATPGFDGSVSAQRASLPLRWRTRLAGLRGLGAGTPAGPLLDRLGPALAAAGRDAAVRAELAVTPDRASIARLETAAASGATIRLADGDGIAIDRAGVRIDGVLAMAGGGLPVGRISVRQATAGGSVSGEARFAPYRAGTATLALAPVAFRATPGGNTSFATRAVLSGPLGDGRVEQAQFVLAGGWDRAGRVVVNPRCARAGFKRLSIAGLVLDPAAFALCPVGRALVTFDRGRLSGGARLAATRVSGRLGGSALTLAVRGGEVRFGDGGLRIDGLAAQLGTADAPTRLAIAALTGRISHGGIAGRFDGAGGRIGAVPLTMADAAGDWRLAGGVLTVGGGLTVADAQTTAPRLNPLPVRDVRLRLADGQVAATGQVRALDGTTRVADVAITHDLARGSGEARLAVPGVTFGERLRPEQLTPLTFGVVAGVTGTVSGAGVIRWSPRGVTSSGDFGTDGIDLAAAFGPVTGLKTRIHFTDLLALESAPGQVATVVTVNPGVPIDDGVVRYQTLSGARVRVEGARWPLAGGELFLEPTMLDFSAPVERRMTFRIAGLDAGKFLQTFDYDNLDASGTFDGLLPIVFDAEGGRLVAGRLAARSGGTIAYRGEIAKENLGTWGNLAFGALRSLRFRALELTLDGPLAGNIVTRARFAGVAQGEGATRNFITRRLARLPFVFNVRIEAPFRSLIGSVRSLYDPTALIEQNLPALLRAPDPAIPGTPPVQPPASENKR